jgi:uncharacterized protein
MEQAETIMGLVTRHWNMIVQALENGDAYVPRLLGNENGVPRANDWAKGFMDGVVIRRSGGQRSWRTTISRRHRPHDGTRERERSQAEVEVRGVLSEERERVLYMLAVGMGEVYDYFAQMRVQSAPSVEPLVRDQPKSVAMTPLPVRHRQEVQAVLHDSAAASGAEL